MNRHDPPPGRPRRVLDSPEAIQAKLRENRAPLIQTRIPRIGHPLDLGDQLLGELAHLFMVETAQRPAFTTDPHEESLKIADYFDMSQAARELAELAMVSRKRRLTYEEANRTPWERGVR